MKLAVTICATKSYTYAMKAQARRVVACLSLEPDTTTGAVILVGDGSDEFIGAVSFYRELLPPNRWEVQGVVGNFEDGLKNYKNPAQLVIARMRSRAFDAARKMQADVCWSLDSDVLPPANALRCMRSMLEFDAGYYGVSTCPYPSQGGGDFLGGRGTPTSPILPDVYDDEREIPEELTARKEAVQKRLEELGGKPDEAWKTERDAVADAIKRCKPLGNVFELNAKRFRRRGWLSAAYPAIGAGAVVPSDWCGFGCTLMGARALALAQFDGYDGSGTEDLFICWRRWYPAGVRINVIPHAPCDHVIRNPGNPGHFVHIAAGHERDGDCAGHLRVDHRPFYQHIDGEQYTPGNDGKLIPKADKAV